MSDDKSVVFLSTGNELARAAVAHLREVGFGVTHVTDGSVDDDGDLCVSFGSDACIGPIGQLLTPGGALVHAFESPLAHKVDLTAEERRSCFELDVLGTLRILDAVASFGQRSTVVLLSSLEVYGMGGGASEEDPLWPSTEYGSLKLAQEQHLHALAEETETRAVTLRLGKPYGPRLSREIAWLRGLVSAEAPARDEPNHVISWVHHDDVARALELALTRPVSGPFNVSDGTSFSGSELARRVSAERGAPRAAGGERSHGARGIRRARELLGFVPTHGIDEDLYDALGTGA